MVEYLPSKQVVASSSLVLRSTSTSKKPLICKHYLALTSPITVRLARKEHPQFFHNLSRSGHVS